MCDYYAFCAALLTARSHQSSHITGDHHFENEPRVVIIFDLSRRFCSRLFCTARSSFSARASRSCINTTDPPYQLDVETEVNQLIPCNGWNMLENKQCNKHNDKYMTMSLTEKPNYKVTKMEMGPKSGSYCNHQKLIMCHMFSSGFSTSTWFGNRQDICM